VVEDLEAMGRDKDTVLFVNPLELKHLKLSRSRDHLPELFDKELKPNNRERAQMKVTRSISHSVWLLSLTIL